MRCEQIQSMLSAYADGELPRFLSGRVAEHLTGCEACTAESHSLSRLVDALRALPEDELPVGLHDRIVNALETARPTVWQRLVALTVPLQPARHLAFGAAAAAVAVLALSTAPVHHATLPHSAPATGRSHLAAQPIAVGTPASTAPKAGPAPPVSPPEVAPPPPTALHPAGIVRTVADLKLPSPAPRAVAPSLQRPAPGETAARRKEKPAPNRGAPPAMPTFDPLATVIDPTGSPAEPQMAHVVVVDTPSATTQPDVNQVASAAGSVEMTTASAAHDDLVALRQRLATEQLQLPSVRVESRRPKRKNKVIPLLHSEF